MFCVIFINLSFDKAWKYTLVIVFVIRNIIVIVFESLQRIIIVIVFVIEKKSEW